MRTCKGSEGQGKQPLELRLGRIRGTYSQAAYNAAFVCSSLAIILANYSLFQRSCIIRTYTNVFFSSHMRVTSSRPARARVVERVIRHLKWLPYVLQPSQYITADRTMPQDHLTGKFPSAVNEDYAKLSCAHFPTMSTSRKRYTCTSYTCNWNTSNWQTL